jgi:hypothetical protein
MRDTSPAAAELQLHRQRTMSGEARLRLAIEMSEAARALALAGLRARHPAWTDRQLTREIARLAGADVPAGAWPA